MTDPSDDELDRLLARGRMGAPARERVLGRVLEKAAPKKSRMASWAGVFAFVSAGAVAAALLLMQGHPEGTFTSKGGTAAATARVEASCIDGDPGRCPMGSTLVFRAEECAEACKGGGYLAAFAERPGSTERIWYFPSSNDPSLPPVAAQAEPQVLARGARIGPEHTPGPYVVTMILLRRPLTREQIADAKGADEVRRWTTPMEVTP
jgi:hypothetical protein